MNNSVPIVTVTILPDEVDNTINDIVICRRCQNPFNRSKSVSESCAAYYRCPNCLTMTTFAHDLMMSCSIQ